MSDTGKEKRKRKRKEKSNDEEKKTTENVDTKKRRGSRPGKGRARKKRDEMSEEEWKKYQKENKAKQLERRNVKQLGLGYDQCYYIKQLFSSIQMKAEESEQPHHRVKKDTITALDNLRECAIHKILHQANLIQQGAKNGVTFDSRVAVNAIRLSVPGDIFHCIAITGRNALQRYKSRKNKDKEDTDQDDDEGDVGEDEEEKSSKGSTKNITGLTLSVARVIREMRGRCTFSRYSPDAAIFVTAALQVILEKIILLTLLYVSRQETAKVGPSGGVSYGMITARDVRNAVESNGLDTRGTAQDVKTHFTRTGLSTFFYNATWSQVGTRRKEITV